MSHVTNLPTDRPRQHRTPPQPPLKAEAPIVAQENLARAFVTFTQAAGSLEKSYTQLQAEVSRLHAELQRTNSELERSLEENARMRSYLTRVVESLPCGVLVVNASGTLQIINPEARRLFGTPVEWVLGDGTRPPKAFAKAIDGVPVKNFVTEHEMMIQDGTATRPIGVLRTSLQDRVDGTGDTVWIVRDLTEQKRIAEERETARKSLALAEIATVLAHEIRNPLGSMELFTGLLADATAHLPETRQWITHLQAGLRALSATVSNVLQFHSQQGGQMLPSELDRLLGETVEFLLPLARQRGQQIKIENQIGKVSMHSDANRLKQVFLNLSLNAFRAMPPGGKLSVRLGWAPQFPGGLVQIDFQDEGRGFAPELLDKIYEPGFTTTPGSPGLGLAVCKKVIEQHGGEIRVKSKQQQGATFSLFLPVSDAGAAA
jgi:two-component system, sensor histidine kinase FlrB